jgi:hypothetical protein
MDILSVSEPMILDGVLCHFEGIGRRGAVEGRFVRRCFRERMIIMDLGVVVRVGGS